MSGGFFQRDPPPHMARVPGAADGDLVVVTDRRSESYGAIGILRIQPGYETVEVVVGCVHSRQDVGGVRPLRPGDQVVKP